MVLVSFRGIRKRGKIGGRSGSDPVHRCVLEFLQQLGRVVKVLVAVLVLGLFLHGFPCDAKNKNVFNTASVLLRRPCSIER